MDYLNVNAADYVVVSGRTTEDAIANEKKRLKLADLNAITVEIASEKSGTVVLDANESSRNLMIQAINASAILNIAEHNWKTHNNDWVLLTVNDLKAALAAGLERHAEILVENV